MHPRHGPRSALRSTTPRAALLGVVAALGVIVPSAGAGHLETRSSANRVQVGDFGSNAPIGCGERRDALSGGFENEFNRETSKLFLFGFNPTGGGGSFGPVPGGPSWRSTVANLGEGPSGRGKQVSVVYCDKRPPRLTLERASVPIEPAAKATAIVRCPRGSEAVSGGFSDKYAGTNGSLVFGFRSKRVGQRRWRASAFNMSEGVASKLIVLVNCDPREPGLREWAKEIEVPAEGTKSTRVRCGRGREAWSAGFEAEVELPAGDGAFPYKLVRIRRRAWRASAFAEGPSVAFTAHVYCGRHG